MTDIIPILILSLHLLAMNVAAGGPIVAIWLEWKEHRKTPLATTAANYLAKSVSHALLAGILLGLLLGAWYWNADYQAVWVGRLHYKLIWAIGEVIFSLFIVLAYMFWRLHSPMPSTTVRVLRMALLLLNGTNLLYHFPPLFLLAGQLSASREIVGVDLRSAAFRERVAADGIPALSVHFGLASIAMAGIVLLGLSLRLLKSQPAATVEASAETPKSDAHHIAVWGASVAMLATLLQIPVGLWVLTSSSTGLRSQLMGQDPIASLCFLISIPLALWLTQVLVTIALGETQRKELIKAMALIVAVVVFMTAAHRLGMKGEFKRAAEQSAALNTSAFNR